MRQGKEAIWSRKRMLGSRAGVLILAPFRGQRIKLLVFYKNLLFSFTSMGQIVAQKVLCLPCLSRSLCPAQLVLEDAPQKLYSYPVHLAGRGQGTPSPGKPEHLVLSLQFYIRRKENFQLLLTGLCYTQFHSPLPHIPVPQGRQ